MTEWEERRLELTSLLMEWAKRVMDNAGPYCKSFSCEDKGQGFTITVEVTRVQVVL